MKQIALKFLMVIALVFLLIPGHALATTLGFGGILTSNGSDIEVLVAVNNADLINQLQGYLNPNLTIPPGPGVAPTNLALNTQNGLALCLYSTAATCGGGGFAGATGLAPLIATPPPPAGTEVLFSIFIAANQGVYTYSAYTVYTGPGTRNPDGQTHDNVTTDGLGIDGTQLFDVGFEDLLTCSSGPLSPCQPSPPALPNSDRDFNDTHYIYYGLQPPSVPEPTSLVLMGFGLVGLSAWRRRQKTKSDQEGN